MAFKFCLILFIVAFWQLPVAQSVNCTFERLVTNYVCRIEFQTIDSENDMQVGGVHLEGHSNVNVTWLAARWSTVQVFPSLIINQFVNLRTVSLGGTNMRLFNSPITNCAHLESLWINANLLNSIPEGMFRNCVNLHDLAMSNNNITRVHDNAFVGLTNLEFLYLSGNQITEASLEWFRPLPSLRVVALSGNQLTSWNRNILANNPKIMSLELANNRIQTLDADVFANIPELSFLTVGSLIEVLPTLQNVPRLETLVLRDNKIRTVSASMFINMRSLKHLHLSNNQIDTINFTMGEKNLLEHLEVLVLSHNNITVLPDNVFSMLTSLLRLDFSDNQIRRLSAASIQPIIQMRDLIVSRNRIERIDQQLFHNATMLQVRAGGNICVNEDFFVIGGISIIMEMLLDRCFNSAISTKQLNIVTALIPVLFLTFW